MAAIQHISAIQGTRQTKTGDTNFSNITGAKLTGFTVGKQYLIIVSALMDGSNANGNFEMRLTHGTTPTVFDGSTLSREPNTTTTGLTYNFFTVWTAVTSEDVDLQFRTLTAAQTVGADQISMTAINLTDDLAADDWEFNENTTDTTLTSAWSTTNNASITFTPATASQDWLILAVGQLNPVSLTISYESRIDRDAGTEVVPQTGWEPDDAVDLFEGFNARVYTLTAASHTFIEASRVTTTGTTETRDYSAIFALRLNAFRNHGFIWTDAAAALTDTPDWVTQVDTLSYTPDVAGDSLVLQIWHWETTGGGASAASTHNRVQVDNSDLITGTTGDLKALESTNDTRDRPGISQIAIINLTAAAHTIDNDADDDAVSTVANARYRTLAVFSMELPAGAAAPSLTQAARRSRDILGRR